MLFVSLAVRAQGVIDEVIWVVGDEAILRSEVADQRRSVLRHSGTDGCAEVIFAPSHHRFGGSE